MVIGGFMPMIFGSDGGIVPMARAGTSLEGIAMEATASLTGYHWGAKKWGMTWAKRGMVPIALGIVGHNIASKLGINRALGRAGIPFIRL